MYIDEETSRLRLIVNWIVDIVVVISVAWFIVFSLGTQITMTGQSMDPVLSQDEYFLLGDNRENSEDSRFASVGNVKKGQIKGKVWLRIRPLRHFGLIRPVT